MSEFPREAVAAPHSTSVVHRPATLDGFVATAASGAGISLCELEPLTTIVVTTCNSQYRITVSESTAIFVQGGRFFPDTTEARLEGSGAGGSFIKVAWIGIGFRMEISSGGRCIVTSPVKAIARDYRSHSALTH